MFRAGDSVATTQSRLLVAKAGEGGQEGDSGQCRVSVMMEEVLKLTVRTVGNICECTKSH